MSYINPNYILPASTSIDSKPIQVQQRMIYSDQFGIEHKVNI